VTVEQEDIDYLLTEANFALNFASNKEWTEKDIQGRYAGLRVLQKSTKKAPSQVTREWEIKADGKGLFYSMVGRLPRHAQMHYKLSMRLLNIWELKLPVKPEYPFPWMPAGNYPQWLTQMTDRARQLDVDSESAVWLIRRHGKHVAEILQLIEREPHMAKRISATVP
ncbi:Glycerol-3-phosphate dehydrogenase, partial [methanotrophic bacterial endosymbiont of Bathymodiolus sp.]